MPGQTATSRRARRLAGAALLVGLWALASWLLAPSSPAAAAEDTADWKRTALAVDAAVHARLELEGVKPAAASDDAEFLRRLTLDVIGTVPTAREAAAFLADRSPDKRARKVEELLQSPAYADAWGMWWHKTLTGLSGAGALPREQPGVRLLAGDAGDAFKAWLHDRMADETPYDAFVRALLTATGRTDENGATGFVARWEGKPTSLAGATSRIFLGLRIQCCQCHDHPYEQTWLQSDFRGMAAFFNATTTQRVPYAKDELKKRNVVDVEDAEPRAFGRLARRLDPARMEKLPEAAKERLDLMGVEPKLWHASAVPDVPGVSRRLLLARWIASPDNPTFSEALVNRYWAHFLGRGLVDPVDGFSSFNEPSHPEALAALAHDFETHGFDLKRLIRILVSTDVYQRTSSWSGAAEPDPALFARAEVRPLTTEQTYFSLARATGLETQLDRVARLRGRQAQQRLFSAFSFVFDDDEMAENEDFQGSVPQGLFFLNGQLVQQAVAVRRGTTLDSVLRTEKRDADRVDALYLAAYGREPSSDERQAVLRFVKRQGGDDGAWEDLFWSLLTSTEFMSNH